MFFNDSKKMAGAVLARKAGGAMPNSESGPSPSAAVDHDFAGLHMASEEMIKAVHAHSPEGLHKALSSYLEQHKGMQPESDSKTDSTEK